MIAFSLATVLLASSPGAVTLPLAPDGFITVWHIDRLGGARASDSHRFDVKAMLPKRKRLKKKQRVTLSNTLVTTRAGRLRFKAGCTRRCVVVLDGQPVLTVEKPYGDWLDDVEAEIAVTPGRHRLEVRVRREVKRGRSPQVVILRLHDTANRVPQWVRISVDAKDGARLLADALPIRWEKEATERGVVVRAVIGPTHRFPGAVDVRLGGRAVSTHGEEVRIEQLVTGGPQTVRLSIGRGGKALRHVQTRVRADPPLLRALADGRAALKAAPGAARFSDARDTLAWSVQHLEGWVRKGDKDTAFLRSRAETITAYATSLKAGRDPLSDERGIVLRAYRSELDRRLQVYSVYIPPSWQPGRKLPLAVALHPSGHHPQLTTRTALGYPRKGASRHATRHLPKRVGDPRSFVVSPYGYRGTGSRYFGKVDVLQVIERVARRYGIDRARISLSGGSLGGLGSWHIGLRLPDRFNVIAPMAGYGTVRHYPSVAGIRRRPWEDYLVARRDNSSFVENARNQPMLCFHGDRDNPKRSTVIVDAYRRLGYRHTYIELEDTGHNAWDPGYEKGQVFRFSRRHRRPDNPREVRFVSGSYRHRSAYWVTIEQYEHHNKLARVRARRTKRQVRLETGNVRRLTLRLGATPLPLSVDGQSLPASSGTTRLRRDGDRWTLAPEDRIPPAEKRPGLSGPMDDIRYEPHVFVYGTADPEQTETNRLRAEYDARYWWNSAEIHMPVTADTELTESDLQDKHVVLYGNPRSNRVLARMVDRLPVSFQAGALVFGGKRYVGDTVGISFIHPNPLAPDRYVVVHAGVTYRGTALSRWLPRWVPDFLIYDERISVQRGGRLMDKRPTLAGGYFDAVWRPPTTSSSRP